MIKLIVSIIVPVLAALVTFLRHDERSVKHHDAAARFSSLKRSLQRELVNYGNDKIDEQLVKRLKEIKDEWINLPFIALKGKINWQTNKFVCQLSIMRKTYCLEYPSTAQQHDNNNDAKDEGTTRIDRA